MRNFGIGAAFGLFLGLLIGLSVSDVVAGAITAMVALIGTILGLRSESAAGPIPGGNGGRVAGFALAASLALVLGVMARTHGMLEPSPAFVRDQWVQAGFPPDAARDLAAFQRLGLVPKGQTAGEGRTSKAGTGALYASGVTDDACDALQNRSYGTLAALKSALQAEGGLWQRLAETQPTGSPTGNNDANTLAGLTAGIAALCQGR